MQRIHNRPSFTLHWIFFLQNLTGQMEKDISQRNKHKWTNRKRFDIIQKSKKACITKRWITQAGSVTVMTRMLKWFSACCMGSPLITQQHTMCTHVVPEFYCQLNYYKQSQAIIAIVKMRSFTVLKWKETTKWLDTSQKGCIVWLF